MGGSSHKPRISVFGPTDHTHSIDRYAHELTRSFPSSVDARLVQYQIPAGLLRKQIYRFWGYRRLAARQQGDFNIIITEAYAYLLNSISGENTICVCHDLHGLTYTGPLTAQYLFYRSRYRWALGFLSRAKFIVATSHNTKKELLRFCPELREERIIPIHNGLDDRWRRVVPHEIRVRVQEKFGLKGKRFILYVGSDLWYKNVAGLVEAFSELSAHDLVLVCVGKLTEKTLGMARRLRVENRIQQLTNLLDDELSSLYQSAEMLVFPSFTEGFGWPPLEAMASGCPTICSNAASLREVCGDASVFVDPSDIHGMADAIRNVMSDDGLRVELITRGRERAAGFSWQATASSFLDLLQRG